MELRARIWAHFERGGEAAPREADRPGVVNSGMLPFVLRWMGLWWRMVLGDGMC